MEAARDRAQKSILIIQVPRNPLENEGAPEEVLFRATFYGILWQFRKIVTHLGNFKKWGAQAAGRYVGPLGLL